MVLNAGITAYVFVTNTPFHRQLDAVPSIAGSFWAGHARFQPAGCDSDQRGLSPEAEACRRGTIGKGTGRAGAAQKPQAGQGTKLFSRQRRGRLEHRRSLSRL